MDYNFSAFKLTGSIWSKLSCLSDITIFKIYLLQMILCDHFVSQRTERYQEVDLGHKSNIHFIVYNLKNIWWHSVGRLYLRNQTSRTDKAGYHQHNDDKNTQYLYQVFPPLPFFIMFVFLLTQVCFCWFCSYRRAAVASCGPPPTPPFSSDQTLTFRVCWRCAATSAARESPAPCAQVK